MLATASRGLSCLNCKMGIMTVTSSLAFMGVKPESAQKVLSAPCVGEERGEAQPCSFHVLPSTHQFPACPALTARPHVPTRAHTCSVSIQWLPTAWETKPQMPFFKLPSLPPQTRAEGSSSAPLEKPPVLT